LSLATAALSRSRLPGAFFLVNMIERRALVYQLVRRDFSMRFVGSAAGWLWAIIHPLVLLASWVFVFQYCLKVPPPPGAGDSYSMYLFAGYLPWLLFQETVQRSANSLVEHTNLITKTIFPSEIIPLSIFFSSLVSHLIATGLFAVASGVILRRVDAGVLALPLFALLLGVFAIGIAWTVSSLQVYLRDTAQVVIVGLTGWFWLTPIFLDETHFPPAARFLVHWNPVAHVVKAYRARLLGAEPVTSEGLLYLAAAAIVSFAMGGLFFRHLKRGFADVL
jgi:ABC-type polysaccharide/polyol phosphate export permease